MQEVMCSKTGQANDFLLFVVCPHGFYGPACDIACPVGCEGGDCDMTTGACIQGCLVGYQGVFCDQREYFLVFLNVFLGLTSNNSMSVEYFLNIVFVSSYYMYYNLF